MATVVLFGPGRQFFTGTIKGLRHGTADMNMLIATGTGAAWVVSVAATFMKLGAGYEELYFDTVGLLVGFIVMGRYLEAKTRGRTSEAIRRLMGLQARTARVVRDGRELDVLVEEVVVDDILIVKPGEKLPVDEIGRASCRERV